MGVEADRPLTPPYGAVFWAAVAAGWAVIGYGIFGVFADAGLTHPRSLALWLAGCLVAHDLVLAPLVFAFGRRLRRAASGALLGLLQVCLFVSGVLVLVSIPVLGRFGERPDNPTLMPRNYALGIIVALGVVWVATSLVVAVIAWHRR